MANEDAKRDSNRIQTLLAVDDAGDVKQVKVNSTTDRVLVDATISSGNTEYTEGDTDATLTGPVILAEGPSDTATPLQVDASKNLQVDIAADSVGIGGGTQYAVDTAAGGADTGTLALVVRDDSLSTLSVADGDYSQLRVNSTGALYVTGGGGGTEYTEDVATADPQVGTATMMERDDALSTVTPAEGDWIGLRGTAEGALWTQDFNSDAMLTSLQLLDDAISGSEMQVDIVASLPAGTNAIGKLAANSGVDIGDVDVTSMDGIAAEGAALGNGILLQGDDGTNRKNINVDATTGDVQIDVTNTVTVDGSGVTQPVSGTVTANAGTNLNTSSLALEAGGNLATVAGAVSGSEMQVDIVASLPAGTNAIGKLAANSGVDIGDVSINNTVTVDATGQGDVPITLAGEVVSTESDGTALGNSQVSVDTTAGGTTILAASAGRAGAVIVNQGSTACYIGTGSVTTSNGLLLDAGESLPLPTDSEIKGITASGSTTIGYLSYA